MTVYPGLPDRTIAPGVGFSLNGVQFGPWGSRALANLTPFASSLAPQVVRFGLLNLGTIQGWNNSTNAPVLNFSTFDRALAFATLLHASTILTVPVGTWGDGNSLPEGMALNGSAPVSCAYGSGYLATPAAYARLLTPLVQHMASLGEHVRYWTIGNEMPLLNSTLVDAYIADFNAAEKAIHARLPTDLVGSDVMTSKFYLPTFAAAAQGVGFLSYHFYPANALTYVGGTYAPPNGTGGAFTDAQLWQNGTDLAHHHTFAAPASAEQSWKNLTGHGLADLDAESNLNAVGGSVSSTPGTDPRQQTTFAGAWLGASLIDAATENVSAFTFFALAQPAIATPTATSAYGGWGFDLVSVSTNGSLVLYAPYYALRMWSAAIPAGAPGLVVTSSDPNLVRAYAVFTPTGPSLALVSGVNTSLRVIVRVAGGNATWWGGFRIDGNSYVERYDPQTHSTSLVQSGVSVLAPQGVSSSYLVAFNGYGVATLRMTVTPSWTHANGDRWKGPVASGDGKGLRGSPVQAGMGIEPAKRPYLAQEVRGLPVCDQRGVREGPSQRPSSPSRRNDSTNS
ncbi:MAG TPA: hypothetical protein VGV89_11055 [Thermoplasmata archaeon]|nr:hypothetical protein [Thermoplasmata archaeon]